MATGLRVSICALEEEGGASKLTKVSKCFACIDLVIRTMLMAGERQRPREKLDIAPLHFLRIYHSRRQLGRSEKERPREDSPGFDGEDDVRWCGRSRR
jgi:hypothetical protein